MIENIKRTIAIAIAVGIISSILITGIVYSVVMNPKKDTTLIIGTPSSPLTIDPVDCWDYDSLLVISQATECLFWYDFRDPDLPLEPLLADSFS